MSGLPSGIQFSTIGSRGSNLDALLVLTADLLLSVQTSSG